MENLLALFKSADVGDQLLLAAVFWGVVLGVGALLKALQLTDIAASLFFYLLALAVGGFFLAALIKGALIILYTPIPGW